MPRISRTYLYIRLKFELASPRALQHVIGKSIRPSLAYCGAAPLQWCRIAAPRTRLRSIRVADALSAILFFLEIAPAPFEVRAINVRWHRNPSREGSISPFGTSCVGIVNCSIRAYPDMPAVE